MLEGLVRQLLLGYLGRYVKDIQKEQLKITLWNGNVLFLSCFFIYYYIDQLILHKRYMVFGVHEAKPQ